MERPQGLLWYSIRMIHRMAKILGRLRFGTPPVAVLVTALFVGSALAVILTVGAACLSAQVPSTRLVHVAVTDRLGRAVIGLEQERFEVVENGVRCAITDFSGADSPMMLVIVSEMPLPGGAAFIRPEDELIQTESFSDALRQLSASKKPRKVILTTIASGTEAIPSGIQVLQTTPANLSNPVRELDDLNKYLLWVKSSAPSANLEVVLTEPPGLPPLRLTWK